MTITAKVTAPEGTSYYGQWSDTGPSAWTGTGTVGIAQYSQWSQAGEFDYFTVDDEVTLFVPPVVSITVGPGEIIEGRTAAPVFQIARTGPTDQPLMVDMRILGDAQHDEFGDYILDPWPGGGPGLIHTITLAAGESFKNITLTARADGVREGDETAILRIEPNMRYTLGQSEAQVVIHDAPVVTIAARQSTASEGGREMTLRIGRVSSNPAAIRNEDLKVFLHIGDAYAGDIEPPESVTISAGEDFIDVEIAAVDDTLPEGRETFTIKIAAEADRLYDLPDLNRTWVHVEDNDQLDEDQSTGGGFPDHVYLTTSDSVIGVGETAELRAALPGLVSATVDVDFYQDGIFKSTVNTAGAPLAVDSFSSPTAGTYTFHAEASGYQTSYTQQVRVVDVGALVLRDAIWGGQEADETGETATYSSDIDRREFYIGTESLGAEADQLGHLYLSLYGTSDPDAMWELWDRAIDPALLQTGGFVGNSARIDDLAPGSYKVICDNRSLDVTVVRTDANLSYEILNPQMLSEFEEESPGGFLDDDGMHLWVRPAAANFVRILTWNDGDKIAVKDESGTVLTSGVQLNEIDGTRCFDIFAVDPLASDDKVRFSLAASNPSDGRTPTFKETVNVIAPAVTMGVDNDRDGVIELTDEDQTTVDKPFLFWLNDSRDRWGGDEYSAAVGVDPDSINKGPIDSATSFIGSDVDVKGNDISSNPVAVDEVAHRDLEDFAQIGVRWPTSLENKTMAYRITLTSNDAGMKVRLFPSVYKAGPKTDTFSATAHVDDGNTAHGIMDSTYWYWGGGSNHTQGRVAPVLLSAGESRSWQRWEFLGDLGKNWTSGTAPLVRLVPLLFEGVGAGQGRLSIELLGVNDKMLGSSSIDLGLRPLNELYDHYSVATGPNVAQDGTFVRNIDPLDMASPVPATATLVSQNAERARFQQQSMSSSTKRDPYFLFVHGWRMKEWERVAFAESAYKRMFWANYKGQFGMFDWPTQWVATSTVDPGNFDRSEFIAWNSAAGLSDALHKIREDNTPTGGALNLSVLAHSMGTIVLSEALYQDRNATNPVVDTAIMSQGALSSHYLSSRTDLLPRIYKKWSRMTDLALEQHTIGHATPAPWTEYEGFNPYGQNNLDVIGGTTPRFRNIGQSATKLLNYYNPDDYALAAWKLDQALKPTESHSWVTVLNKKGDLDFGNVSISNVDSFLEWWHATSPTVPIPGFADTQYVYNEDDNKFYRVNMKYVPDPLGGGSWELDSVTSLSYAANRYEMFAFCASSIVAPIGAVNWTNFGGVFNGGQDLRHLGGTFDNTQVGHSAEFVQSNLMVGAYWRKVVGDTQ